MTKLGFLLFSSFFIFLSITIVNAMPQFENQTNIFDRDYPDSPPDDSGFFSGVFDTASDIMSYIGVFFDMLLFRVDGLPFGFNVIFILLTIGMVYVIATLIRGGG